MTHVVHLGQFISHLIWVLHHWHATPFLTHIL